ncbi:hypothetical protein M0804_006837 [Polistes exclamans]|nr:hypothetical protein M0804_006837 [Polistes exclamans]
MTTTTTTTMTTMTKEQRRQKPKNDRTGLDTSLLCVIRHGLKERNACVPSEKKLDWSWLKEPVNVVPALRPVTDCRPTERLSPIRAGGMVHVRGGRVGWRVGWQVGSGGAPGEDTVGVPKKLEPGRMGVTRG